MWRLTQEFKDRVGRRLENLYGPSRIEELLARLSIVRSRYAHIEEEMDRSLPKWSQNDVVLITYGDMITAADKLPLATLHRFAGEYLSDSISCIHILPFFPYSSDDGFSVIDYRRVDPDLGDWEMIHRLAEDFKLMVDLVINHVSSKSTWFQNYLDGIAPERKYFIEVKAGTDLSRVVRPRSLPLLTKVDTIYGPKYVWTTFSADQVDLNFANPDLLLEMLDVFLSYIDHGAGIIRLDAIAYLWKEIETSCLNLDQTHELVKLLRDIVHFCAPEVLLLSETNLPHDQNMSYFGEADEAHLIYQFSLPPLLLHALQTGETRFLVEWASTLPKPPAGCNYLNFTASHDGIGLRPLEGLLDPDEVQELVLRIQQLGGLVSTRNDAEGNEQPYELNITYFDALGNPKQPGDTEIRIKRFLCSQAIMLSLQGIPAVYFHSLTATRNNLKGVRKTGQNRSINRARWRYSELVRQLDNSKTTSSRVFNQYRHLLRVRKTQQAFHPDTPQQVLVLEDGLFGLVRKTEEPQNTVYMVANCSEREFTVKLSDLAGKSVFKKSCYDLISGAEFKETIAVKPYQTFWISNRPAGDS